MRSAAVLAGTGAGELPDGEGVGGVKVCPSGAEKCVARAAQEQARWRPGERVYTVTRAGCPGIQSYAQTWSGDNTTSWASLRFGLRTGLNMGLSGMFNVGHDVGGFAGPSPDGELLARWLQAGALHPRFVMNSWKADGAVTTPWMHPAVTPHARWAMRLRLRLMPLLYSLYVARPRPAAPHAGVHAAPGHGAAVTVACLSVVRCRPCVMRRVSCEGAVCTRCLV